MNKGTGIVRRVDHLGRLALPIEFRRSLEITEEIPLEVFTEDQNESIILRKYRTKECVFCQSMDDLKYYREWFVCVHCIQEFKNR